MRELFIATSYHHIMVAIAKMRQNNSVMDLLISNFSTGNEYWEKLLPEIEISGWFGRIIYFDERTNHPPKPNHIIETIKYEWYGEKKVLNTIANFDIDSYDMIYVIDDKMFPAATIIRHGRSYTLCEDTAYTFQLMEKCGSSTIMRTPYRFLEKLFQFLHYWHPVYGYADCCKRIEVSSTIGVPKQLPQKKLVVVDRMDLINSIPNNDVSKLCKMFLDSKELELMLNGANTVLIMTSLYRRGVQYEEEQVRICEKVMSKYMDSDIIIKPHPRDLTDYKKAFPNAIVLNARFPSELINYVDGIMLKEAVSVGSTAVNTCKYAKKTTYYSLEDIGEKII